MPLVLVGALGLLAAACGSDEQVRRGHHHGRRGHDHGRRGDDHRRRRGHDHRGRWRHHHRSRQRQWAASARALRARRRPSTRSRARTPGSSPADLQCGAEKPLKAEGDPIIIGFQNPQGDPAGSFPEYTDVAEAAVKYINEELGGLGGNPSKGKAGRPIKLETCFMAINPADSQKCANELAGKKPFVVLSTLNFFGNQFPIYQPGRHHRRGRHADHGR